MSQQEDTELRDLVIGALDKNGSLAKIRAALRANIFTLFENESEKKEEVESINNIINKQNETLAIALIEDFLHLRGYSHTLFVFRGEIKQCSVLSRKQLNEKLILPADSDDNHQPLLVKLLEKVEQQPGEMKSNETLKVKDENCTYIVHDDQDSQDNSAHSDQSPDAKNKLLVRLQLENSDTDSSSDSKDKSVSEYIPSDYTNSNKLDQNYQSTYPQSSFFFHLNLKQLGDGDNENTSKETHIEEKLKSEQDNTENNSAVHEMSQCTSNDSKNYSKISQNSSQPPNIEEDASIYQDLMKELDYSNDFTNESSSKSESLHEEVEKVSINDLSEISSEIAEEINGESESIITSVPVSVIKDTKSYVMEENDLSVKHSTQKESKDETSVSIASSLLHSENN